MQEPTIDSEKLDSYFGVWGLIIHWATAIPTKPQQPRTTQSHASDFYFGVNVCG